ncbi:TPA: class I SAM-dependent methyltransferase, partial [Salmonella enterica subsp. enterica serovar Enteritidis]
ISNYNDLTKSVNDLFHFDSNGNGGDIIVDSGLFPILWTIASIDKKYNNKDKNYYQDIYCDDDFNDYAQSFLSQMSANGNAHDLIKNISNMHFLLNEGRTENNFYSDSLRNLNKINWYQKVYPFCDLFLFHQIKEVLFRQLSVPYHVNMEKTLRWKYKAKDTNMYMDMLVLDECRYLYDWMPSLDMFYSGMMDIERQFSFRFILDAVAKHRMVYNNEFFYGTASVSK